MGVWVGGGAVNMAGTGREAGNEGAQGGLRRLRTSYGRIGFMSEWGLSRRVGATGTGKEAGGDGGQGGPEDSARCRVWGKTGSFSPLSREMRLRHPRKMGLEAVVGCGCEQQGGRGVRGSKK